MVACYLELYEESEVEHINDSKQGFTSKGWSVTMWLGIYSDLFMHVHAISGVHHIYIDSSSYNSK